MENVKQVEKREQIKTKKSSSEPVYCVWQCNTTRH